MTENWQRCYIISTRISVLFIFVQYIHIHCIWKLSIEIEDTENYKEIRITLQKIKGRLNFSEWKISKLEGIAIETTQNKYIEKES